MNDTFANSIASDYLGKRGKRGGTVYEGVAATIETITARNVQLRYDRVVRVRVRVKFKVQAGSLFLFESTHRAMLGNGA
jgi:hypothetical protein